MGSYNHSLAVSALHKALRVAARDEAHFAAAWLSRYGLGASAAWRRLLAFPAEDMNGAGVVMIAAHYIAWETSRAPAAIHVGIDHLCDLVETAGQLDRTPDELKNAAIYWLQGGRTLPDGLNEYEQTRIRYGFEYLKALAPAASSLYLALENGDIETSAHIAMYLVEKVKKDRAGAKAAWRPILQFPSQHMPQDRELAEFITACYICWKDGYEADNLIFAILRLCEVVRNGEMKENPLHGLRLRLVAMLANKQEVPPLRSSYDIHTGHGSLADFWAYVNLLGPASPWREDAKLMIEPKKEEKKKNKLKTLFD